jgi:hypothetical protein
MQIAALKITQSTIRMLRLPSKAVEITFGAESEALATRGVTTSRY